MASCIRPPSSRPPLPRGGCGQSATSASRIPGHEPGGHAVACPVAAARFALRDLETALTEQVNRGIFQANESSAHYSQNEIARILGVSRQAIAKRIGLGEQVY